jgi:hypothetical protein
MIWVTKSYTSGSNNRSTNNVSARLNAPPKALIISFLCLMIRTGEGKQSATNSALRPHICGVPSAVCWLFCQQAEEGIFQDFLGFFQLSMNIPGGTLQYMSIFDFCQESDKKSLTKAFFYTMMQKIVLFVILRRKNEE